MQGGEGLGVGEGESSCVLELYGLAGGVRVELEIHRLVSLIEILVNKGTGVGHLSQKMALLVSLQGCCEFCGVVPV